jgi:cell wall assembly regulator SMI1
MMKDLGDKLKQELRPGTYVLSNVFAIPNWTPIGTSQHGTHIYRMPQKTDTGTASLRSKR